MEEVKEKTIEEQKNKIFKKNFSELKKKYGENFAKLCRSTFPVLMEEENTLLNIIESIAFPSKFLYEDLVNQNKTNDFVAYILYKYMNQLGTEKSIETNKTPKEIFEELGYKFYKCKTHKDVLKFKKFYAKDEKICTFRDEDRIKNFDIFFVVKKDINRYKRKDYSKKDPDKKYPQREDEYSTSVMSIQFSKYNGTFYIISRYNHTVMNPNSVYNCNLDLIAPGLTNSFKNTYGLESNPTLEEVDFSLKGYLTIKDKLYKYNIGRDNVLYCPNNITIDLTTKKIKQYDKNTIELIDNFLVDKKNCTITLCPGIEYHDAFLDTVQNLTKIEVEKIENSTNRLFKLTQEDGNVVELVVNKRNQIIKYSNEKIKEIGDNFLYFSKAVEECNLPNVEKINNGFLRWNNALSNIHMPNVKYIGDNCLSMAESLKSIDFPLLETFGDDFLVSNKKIESINLPNVVNVGRYFLYENKIIKTLTMPKVKNIGCYVLSLAQNIKEFNFPELEILGDYCFVNNIEHQTLFLPNLKEMGGHCFENSSKLKTLILPKVEKIDWTCFCFCDKLKYINIENAKFVYGYAFNGTSARTKVIAPNLEYLDSTAFNNRTVKSSKFIAPKQVKRKYLINNYVEFKDEENHSL